MSAEPNTYQAQITAEVGTPAGAPATAREAEQRAQTWRAFADIDPAILEQVRSRTSITSDERDAAIMKRRQLMEDSEFKSRYLAGDRVARKELALVNIMLGLNVRDAPRA